MSNNEPNQMPGDQTSLKVRPLILNIIRLIAMTLRLSDIEIDLCEEPLLF